MENNEFGLSNSGDNNVVQVPVELKDHSNDPALQQPKRERTDLEKEVDAEIIAKGLDAVNDFDETQAIVVPAKKRGRKPKTEAVAIRQFNCATCREMIPETTVMKMEAGDNRYAAFCPNCQKSLGFVDYVVEQKIDRLIRHNPVKN